MRNHLDGVIIFTVIIIPATSVTGFNPPAAILSQYARESGPFAETVRAEFGFDGVGPSSPKKIPSPLIKMVRVIRERG